MRQQFFTQTIQSNFIKSLLYNTPLPICNYASLGDYIIKGHTYIYNRSLIKCTQNGYLRPNLLDLQSLGKNQLGMFILGYSTLGFGQTITKRSFGGYIFKDKYYLLGEYNLRYGLEDGDPNYSFFNSNSFYNIGDIVVNTYLDRNCLYVAIKNVSPGIWNADEWQFIQAEKAPFQLILCTDSGIIGDKPSGASYKTVQEFEPETLKFSSNSSDVLDQYLSGRTYYVIARGLPGQGEVNWTYTLVYNDYPGYLSDQIAEYDVIDSYIPEKFYSLYTQKYLSPYDYYDSGTHKELGRLLRFYSSAYQLNLLPYYNCWDGSYLDGFQIVSTGLVDKASTSTKLLKVPVKFNKKYTIAIDCNSEVRIVPAFIKLNDTLQVKLGIGNMIDLSQELANQVGVSIYNQLGFKSPITYEIPNRSEDSLSTIEGSVTDASVTVSEFFQRYENDLYLMIQIPASNDSSVVILEGDYTDTSTQNIFDVKYINSLSSLQLNSYLLSDLSLLQINDGVSYPFADRLIEYLLDNVITNRDEIGEDIVRIRQKLGADVVYDPNITAWDEYLRKTIYDLYMDSPKTLKLDVSGFVDKETEQFINLMG